MSNTENILRDNVREEHEQVHRLQARLVEVIAERDALAAKLAELERQEPALYVVFSDSETIRWWSDEKPVKPSGREKAFYARPVPAAPAAPTPVCDCGDTITDSNAGCCIDCINQIRADRDKPPTDRMLFWQTHPYNDYPIHDDEESMVEQFIADMGDDMVADFKVSRAVELEPRMMRVYAPTDDESGVRWEWLP